jgi:hypothetical protein
MKKKSEELVKFYPNGQWSIQKADYEVKGKAANYKVNAHYGTGGKSGAGASPAGNVKNIDPKTGKVISEVNPFKKDEDGKKLHEEMFGKQPKKITEAQQKWGLEQKKKWLKTKAGKKKSEEQAKENEAKNKASEVKVFTPEQIAAENEKRKKGLKKTAREEMIEYLEKAVRQPMTDHDTSPLAYDKKQKGDIKSAKPRGGDPRHDRDPVDHNDPEVKELNKLKNKVKGTKHEARVQAEIDSHAGKMEGRKTRKGGQQTPTSTSGMSSLRLGTKNDPYYKAGGLKHPKQDYKKMKEEQKKKKPLDSKRLP